MLYQALIGAWPLEGVDTSFITRMQAYALKAAREGKQETSWTNRNEAYEDRLSGFVGAILDRARAASFIDSFAAFAERTALIGALNSLSQLVLKLTLPGVPDFYQGTELWDLSLVDPDNRRLVDFAAPRKLLDRDLPWPTLVENWRDGGIKLALIRKLLAIRHEFAELFRDGAYSPLRVEGLHAEHVIGFTRALRRQTILVLVGRHFAPLTGKGHEWPRRWEARLAAEGRSRYRDLLRGKADVQPQVSAIFHDIPVAVLANEPR